MKSYLYILFFFVTLSALSQEALSLEECYLLAEKNYPLARQTDLLLEKSKSEIEIINK